MCHHFPVLIYLSETVAYLFGFRILAGNVGRSVFTEWLQLQRIPPEGGVWQRSVGCYFVPSPSLALRSGSKSSMHFLYHPLNSHSLRQTDLLTHVLGSCHSAT